MPDPCLAAFSGVASLTCFRQSKESKKYFEHMCTCVVSHLCSLALSYLGCLWPGELKDLLRSLKGLWHAFEMLLTFFLQAVHFFFKCYRPGTVV